MPSGDEIQQYLTGAWRLLMGKPDGVRLLDVSADGFWNSFYAIVVALPALMVDWVGAANELSGPDSGVGGRLSVAVVLAVIDLIAWVVPLLGLGLVARQARIADRYVHFVVASNWSSVLLVWLMLPLVVLNVFVPDPRELIGVIYLVAVLAVLVLGWRLTNAVLGKGAAVATAVFVATLFASLSLSFFLRSLFGLDGP